MIVTVAIYTVQDNVGCDRVVTLGCPAGLSSWLVKMCPTLLCDLQGHVNVNTFVCSVSGANTVCNIYKENESHM